MLGLAFLGGCRSRAHNDVYRQRMASEIRVLEDQLYDADYQNRILQQKLELAESRVGTPSSKPPASKSSPSVSPAPYHPTFPPPVRTDSVPNQNPVPLSDSQPPGMEYGFESDLELPDFDTGSPIAPEALTDPEYPNEPIEMGTPSPPAAPTETDAATSKPDSSGAADSDSPFEKKLLPAPGGPEPPGKSDTDIPKIEPGDILPPPGKEDGEALPPGQISLPDSVQAAAGEPTEIRLHPGLSRGYRINNQIQGMNIVVNVLDKVGKTVELEDFDVEAELSVVILDPERENEDARLGRWDFSKREISTLIQSDPISGFHIPIKWKDRKPVGDEIIVHVRIRAEEDEMRCNGTLQVEKAKVAAGWSPRGEETSKAKPLR